MKINLEFVLLDTSRTLLGLQYHKTLLIEEITEEDSEEVNENVYPVHVLTIGLFFFYVSILVHNPQD